MNIEAMHQAIIRELYKQGIDYAQVHIIPNYQHETHFVVEEFGALERTDLPDSLKVENQVICPFPVPDGLENIRELDLEIHELVEAGLIERKDCGYALTQQ